MKGPKFMQVTTLQGNPVIVRIKKIAFIKNEYERPGSDSALKSTIYCNFKESSSLLTRFQVKESIEELANKMKPIQ